MTLDDRTTIQTELDKGTSFQEIGIILGKDCTTISKEVRKHICRQKTGAMGKAFISLRPVFKPLLHHIISCFRSSVLIQHAFIVMASCP